MEIEQMLAKADKIADYYVKLQQKIFYLLIDSFKTTRPELINQDDPESILEWRLRALSKIGALTKDTIKIVSNTSGKSESYIYDLIKDDGLEVAKDINAELSDALKQNKPISPEVNSIISSYAAQTFRDINNNVNQSLLSTNYSKNGAVRAYQDIINQTVLEVQTGLKTPDRALKDNIYKWRDNGIKTNLVDKAGHNWSLEGYTRTVIRTTAARTYNDLRIQSMKDFDSVLATMSSHPASRPACAPIQGKIVNIVPRESSRCDPEYPSIYDHGYGKPSGCFGINCGHKLYPYIKGVSHNFQKQYDPKEAVEKQKIQQKQRYYERNIRRLKYDLDLA
uniref:phage minor capsid protein n=1 Tax=Ligilactobacillus ruminis TaxID=1623 RepID=UPI0034A0F022